MIRLAIVFLCVSLAAGTVAASVGSVGAASGGSAWSPYLAGGLIGLLTMATHFFSGTPIGASSAYANAGGLALRAVGADPRRISYFDKHPPVVDWEVMLVIGVVIGAFIAAATGGELTGRWLPALWVERFGETPILRVAAAMAGGVLMAFGARLAGGCTSGHGISGALQLSVASWLSLACFLIGGVITAHLLYLW